MFSYPSSYIGIFYLIRWNAEWFQIIYSHVFQQFLIFHIPNSKTVKFIEQNFPQSVNTVRINVLYPIFTRFHVTVEITSTLENVVFYSVLKKHKVIHWYSSKVNCVMTRLVEKVTEQFSCVCFQLSWSVQVNSHSSEQAKVVLVGFSVSI